MLSQSARIVASLCAFISVTCHAQNAGSTSIHTSAQQSQQQQAATQSSTQFSKTVKNAANNTHNKPNYQDPAYMTREFKRGRMAFLFGEYDAAHKILQPLADHNYGEAQAVVGWMYHTGKGRPKDLHKAFDWYQKAAQQNEPIAQNNLGVFYEQGLAGDISYKNAAKWYRESAEWGYRYAQYNLGILYLEGRGVTKDADQAQYWLQIAALQGVNQAIDKLKLLSRQVHNKHNLSKTGKAAEVSPLWERQHGTQHSTVSNPHHEHQSEEYRKMMDQIRSKQHP